LFFTRLVVDTFLSLRFFLDGMVDAAYWYKNLQFYIVYPDSFGDLYGLIEKLPYISNLGVNAVHILPLFKSGGIDAGFDIIDYYTIDEKYGGNVAFETLLEQAKILGIHIFIDFVLNHVSHKHEWFIKATSGNKFYQDFFISQTQKPKLLSQTKQHAVYEIDGKRTEHKIIFPEFSCGEHKIPHYVNVHGVWYYHTFYPQQLDLNWDNPQVFAEMSKVILFWGKRGVHFRLDAIPFVCKDLSRNCEVTQKTFDVLAQLHDVAHSVGSVFMAEATKSNSEIIPYFGTKDVVRCELAYNFELMNALWLCLLDGTHNMMSVLQSIGISKPQYAQWVTFLRSHDELMLKSQDASLNEQLREFLLASSRGIPFKEGRAVAGRLASFLDGDTDKIIFAHSLLASFPGNIAIYYGDEVGVQNNFSYMDSVLAQKKALLVDSQKEVGETAQSSTQLTIDARDCNRGPLFDSQIEAGRLIYNEISLIMRTRLLYIDFFSVIPEISYLHSLVKLEYRLSSGGSLVMYLNFGEFSEFEFLDEFGSTFDSRDGLDILYMGQGVSIGSELVELLPYSMIWVMMRERET
jgi:maltose alpha-D-glucosyltransferase / alpha-amylase